MSHSENHLSKDSGRAEQLQFLRFCAFMAVFLWHGKVWVPAWFPGGNAAAESVSFFFVLSGLGTGYSFFLRRTPYSLREHGRYIWRKLKKIYPLYITMALFSFVFSGLPYWLVTRDFGPAAPHLIQFARTLLMVQSWFPGGDYFSFNGVGWFISSIMFLYLVTPWLKLLLVKIYENKHRYSILAAVFAAVFAVTTGYCYATGGWDQEFWQYVFPPARLGEYFMGMILGFFLCSQKDRTPDTGRRKGIFTCLEAAALLLWAVSLCLPFADWQFRIVHWLVPNLFLSGVFALGYGAVSELFRMRPFHILGDVSFESFLIHANILALYGITGVGAAGRLGNLFSLFFCLVLTLMLAFMIAKPSLKR